MQKSIGNLTESLVYYEKALATYEKTVGCNHNSYFSTLTNVGVLYKSMADQHGQDNEADKREEFLGKAEASLSSALELVGQRLCVAVAV